MEGFNHSQLAPYLMHENSKGLPKVVFVDDDFNFLRAIKRSLKSKSQSWNILFLNCSATAEKILQGCCYDVLVTDLSMPKRSGLDLVKKQNIHSPNTQCIFLTGKVDLNATLQIINSVNVFRILTKPFETQHLIEAIECALIENQENSTSLDLQAKQSLDGVLNIFPTGIIILNAEGTLIYANEEASSIFMQNDGLSITTEGKLKGSNTHQTRQLNLARRTILDRSITNKSLALKLTRTSRTHPLRGVLSLINSNQLLLLISDCDKINLLSTDTIKSLFGTTQREAEVVQQLINGDTADQIATKMGLTPSTVRTYIKRLLAKTGTKKQHELVSLVSRIPMIKEKVSSDTST